MKESSNFSKEGENRLKILFQKKNIRILVVVRDHMSGLLYAVPGLRALRQRFPSSNIALLANPYASPILEGCPYVDKIFSFFQFREEHEYGNHRFTSLSHKMLTWLCLFGRVDLVIHLRHVGNETLLFCRMLGRPFQVGYSQGRYDHFLDLNLGEADVKLDSRARNAKILEELGMTSISPQMEIWISPGDTAWAVNWLHVHGWQEGERLIVFHPGCHWGCNEWLDERWVDLGNSIHKELGAKIVITGSVRERHQAVQIANAMEAQPFVAAGETTLTRFAALIQQADAVVSVDSAPTQICQALKKPSVILMGAGNPAWNGPLPGEPTILLQKWDSAEEGTLLCKFAAGSCHSTNCHSRLDKITVEEVMSSLKTILQYHRSESRLEAKKNAPSFVELLMETAAERDRR